MKLLYISTFQFSKVGGEIYALPSCADSFFEKYLNVFDAVRVLGEEMRAYLSKDSFVRMNNPDISVEILEKNTLPRDFSNDKEIKKILFEEIKNAEAILIKPASRKGMMAIKIAEKLNKPYMIEMTGDIHNALLQSGKIIKKLYAPILYKKILKTIKDCEYGLYVSENYLQKKYPIKGKVCGCTDVVLEKADDCVLNKRFEKIKQLDTKKRVDLALIGFYQGVGKGVDTAIRAISQLPDTYHLSILGNGTQENRDKWIEYGKKFGVYNRIHFPSPLPTAIEVLRWLDTMDMFILPTRSEGFGRCVAEAMSRGCPCITSNVCTMPELIPIEWTHDMCDDKKLADLIFASTNDKEVLNQMAKENYENSKRFDFDILKQRRNAFLEEFKNYCEGKINKK